MNELKNDLLKRAEYLYQPGTKFVCIFGRKDTFTVAKKAKPFYYNDGPEDKQNRILIKVVEQADTNDNTVGIYSNYEGWSRILEHPNPNWKQGWVWRSPELKSLKDEKTIDKFINLWIDFFPEDAEKLFQQNSLYGIDNYGGKIFNNIQSKETVDHFTWKVITNLEEVEKRLSSFFERNNEEENLDYLIPLLKNL